MSLPTDIICTTYNASETLCDTLDSVLAQSSPDWRLLIVDDGSTDETVEIIKSYGEKDKRIRLVDSRRRGRAKALNYALANVRSSYFLNIDSDDLAHPQRLEILCALMRRYPNLWTIAARSLRFAVASEVSWPMYGCVSTLEPVVKNIDEKLFLHNCIHHSSVICDTRNIRAVGGYNEARESQVDYDLWLRIIDRGGHIGMSDCLLSAKRLHSGQKFEAQLGRKYATASVALQLSYIKRNWRRLWRLPLVGLRLLWLSLPHDVRRGVKRWAARIANSTAHH